MTQVLRSREGRSRTCLLEEVTDKTRKLTESGKTVPIQREQDVQKFGSVKGIIYSSFQFSAIIHRKSTIH